MKKSENLLMWNAAGYRERYAMSNGNRQTAIVNGHRCYIFTYSRFDPYQDANGATWDTVRRAWVG